MNNSSKVYDPWKENKVLSGWLKNNLYDLFYSGYVYDFNKPYNNPLLNFFSSNYGIDKEYIYIGAGASDCIKSFLSINDWNNVYILEKEFGLYNYCCDSLKIRKKLVDTIDFNELYDYFCKINTQEDDLLCISTPMWFTGEQLSKKQILLLGEVFCGKILIDETYIKYGNMDFSMIGDVEKNERIVVINSISKSYRLHGLRVGTLCTSMKLPQHFRISFLSGNSISSVSVNFLLSAFYDKSICEVFEKHIIWTKCLRELIYKKLSNYKDIEIKKSQANFGVLFMEDKYDVKDLLNIEEVRIGKYKQKIVIKYPIWTIEEANILLTTIQNILSK